MDHFKQSKFSKERNFGQFVGPFVSGLLGASLIVGVCFGVPEVKNHLLGTSRTVPQLKTSTSSSQISKDLVDLVEYSDTSVAVAQRFYLRVWALKSNIPLTLFLVLVKLKQLVLALL